MPMLLSEKKEDFLYAKNSPVNYGPVTLQLIERVQKPKLVVVIPCCGHQEENSQITQGDKKTGQVRKQRKQPQT